MIRFAHPSSLSIRAAWSCAAAILLTSASLPAVAQVPGLADRPLNLTCVAPDRPPSTTTAGLETVVTITGTGTPTAFRPIPGNPDRWLLVKSRGEIVGYERSGDSFVRTGIVMDISERVALTFAGEGFDGIGAVGLAFHPDFQQNGEVFLFYGYTTDPARDTPPLTERLSRFVSTDGGLTIDPTSEQVLLALEQNSSQHKGGNLVFGSDGYLYVGIGDDLRSDPAQDLNSYFGKLLRIDVDGGDPYGIPPDNPFLNAGGLPELYAIGLRQPWRWSFDRATGDLWLGDVGATRAEEVNRIEAGGNYGWPHIEGFECLDSPACENPDYILPLTEFHNDGPSAIIGGYVYRGSAIPELQGTYVYADGRAGVIYGLFYDDEGNVDPRIIVDSTPRINSFAEDTDGELFVLTPNPKEVMRLVPAAEPGGSTFPAKLSQTGCFLPGNPGQPAAGLIPYTVNTPLWSDGAAKERWIAMPDWDVQNSTIQVQPNGDFDFPLNTVLVKSFRLGGELIETRLFIRHSDGIWTGYSYEWDEDGLDATLLVGSKSKTIDGQVWRYPGRNDCLQCHTAEAGRSLGPEIAQLNGDLMYPSSGLIANQLATLDHIGLLAGGLPAPLQDLDRLPALGDGTASLNDRARAYLHANCAMCHLPGGGAEGSVDLRYYVSGAEMNVYDLPATQSDLGVPGAKLLTPGHPELSVLTLRMRDLTLDRMPPLGTSLMHQQGVDVIEDWIRSGTGFDVPDSDGDEFADNLDNCLSVANPSQLDTDADGYGNACDGDFDNDCAVSFSDLGILKAAFFSAGVQDADMNGDAVVNFADLALFKAGFLAAPGPSGPGGACDAV